MKKLLFFLLALATSLNVFAQTRTITGVVTDAKGGSTLPGVSVTVKEVPSIGTQTDANGRYSFSCACQR